MALAKARLVEITSYIPQKKEGSEVPASADGAGIEAHFNPQTLKVSINSNNQGGNQPGGGSGKQFVGSGTSSLQVELLFDTTVARKGAARSSDVRRITEKLAKFIVPKPQPNDPTNRHSPPLGRFEWGSFIFEGVVDQIDENLDYFSEEGVPLRATISLKMSRDDIAFTFAKVKSAGGGGAPGAGGQQPMSAAQPDESVQRMAARNGQDGDWKAIAAANNIDDPLRLQAGALLKLSAGASAGFSAGASAGFGASVGAGASASAGLSASASAGLSAGLGAGVGFSAGAGASAGFGASAGASAGFGASAGASAGFGASASASAGFGASAGASASAGFGASASASAGFGASAGASASAGTGLQAGVGVKLK